MHSNSDIKVYTDLVTSQSIKDINISQVKLEEGTDRAGRKGKLYGETKGKKGQWSVISPNWKSIKGKWFVKNMYTKGS